MTSKHIVILGAGYGGVHAAKLLSKKYKKYHSVKITLIDRNPFHTLMTELHEVAGGRVEADSVQVDLFKIFNKSRVNLVIDEITKVDTDSNVVTTLNGEYKYDYLIIGTGSEPAYFGTPGVKEHGFSLWSLKDALKIRHHIENMFDKARYEKDEKKRRAMLTFIVAGAGFTGIEMIGELVDHSKVLAKKYDIDPKEIKLINVEAVGRILNMLDEGGAQKVANWLTKHGVDLMLNSPITEVTPDNITLKDGKVIDTKTLIWTCGIQGCGFAKEFGIPVNNRNRLNANEYMQSLEKPNVYLVGDCAWVEEGQAKSLPQIVEAAVQTAETAAHNIIADMEMGTKKPFKSNYHGFMVSVGSHYCVANVGGMKMSGFFAMATKHLVNLHYLFGVGGFYLIIKYLRHEFFNMKDKRSFLGGHLSAKVNALWLFFLRVFTGAMWLHEGLVKVNEGWFKEVKIPMFLDATSSASAAAESTSTVVPLISSPPAFFTAFMEILKPFGFYFQIMIVCMEIAIGLALLAGLFTFLASAASVFLCLNFIISAMAGLEIVWFIAAGIALMGGAGRTLGLDYFVMPWLQKLLSRYWFGKRKAA
ncbi:NADH dehydrogenase-like protein YjlD [Oxobacter pfennigii]|uniref:NADH:ubiquinone reductase (non-electrogenic) n=1 Tax=Oxobacter pfennigii TaxID=36849 RepID=A0A0P9AB70_9CLOT|nr:FAD-dependent oxidoreductase [Oxobacter pfennigii]KPU42309.1 NADH dehydrogenase-like protein YjlD [Oxobacter pfennigii]